MRAALLHATYNLNRDGQAVMALFRPHVYFLHLYAQLTMALGILDTSFTTIVTIRRSRWEEASRTTWETRPRPQVAKVFFDFSLICKDIMPKQVPFSQIRLTIRHGCPK